MRRMTAFRSSSGGNRPSYQSDDVLVDETARAMGWVRACGLHRCSRLRESLVERSFACSETGSFRCMSFPAMPVLWEGRCARMIRCDYEWCAETVRRQGVVTSYTARHAPCIRTVGCGPQRARSPPVRLTAQPHACRQSRNRGPSVRFRSKHDG